MSIGEDYLIKLNEVVAVMEETKLCLCVSVCVFWLGLRDRVVYVSKW